VTRPPRQPDRSDVRESELEWYDAVVERERTRGGVDADGRITAFNSYYGALLNGPELCFHVAALGRAVRVAPDRPGSYSHAQREWADHVLCSDWQTNCVMPGHLEDALLHGVRAEAILALREGREGDLTADEQELTAFIRQVVSGTVTDESFAGMVTRLGQRGAVEYTIFVTYLAMTMRLYEALTGSSGPSDEELLGELREYVDGTRPLPTQVRIGAG